MSDLRERFLARFVEAAIKRLDAAALASAADVARQLHALAGEAALLDFHEIAAEARAAEQSARAWAAGDEGRGRAVQDAVARLRAEVDSLRDQKM